jgi:hypothetical protein
MKEIELLEAQMSKLDKKGFDLNAWKQYTVVLLARIFGENNPKIKQVEKIEYDYSSWSLRDTSGSSEYMETCKKLGREILQASIDELKAFGVPDLQKPADQSIDINTVISALEDQLTVSQFRNLKSIINSEDNLEKKKKALRDFLKNLDDKFSLNVLLGLLSHPDLSGKL